MRQFRGMESMIAGALACARAALQPKRWPRGLPKGLLLLPLLLGVLPAAQAAIPAGERNVLLAIYNQTGGASWTNNTGWNGNAGTECTWSGVACDGGQTHVIGIILQTGASVGNNLVGTLPSLSALTSLQTFAVGHNQLSGPIPSLAGLSALQYFYADHNQLTGSIPALTGLTALREFYVNSNQLTGAIPALTGLSALQEFSVSGNQLTGSLPTLAGLTALVEFDASFNQLTGAMPSLAGLTALQYFDVGANQLTGSVPSLSGLAALKSFYVYLNRLTGPMALPPSPSALLPGESNVCGNQLASTGNASADAAWDVASGSVPAFDKPGWLACQAVGFGDQVVGTTSAPQVLAFTATASSGTITIDSIAISGDFAQASNCVGSFAPGTGCTISVTFTPTAVGLRAGNLTIVGRSEEFPRTETVEIPVQGTGVPAPVPAEAIPSVSESGLLALAALVALLGVALARRRGTLR